MELSLDLIITKARTSKYDYYYEFTEGYRANYADYFEQGQAVHVTATVEGDSDRLQIIKMEKTDKKEMILQNLRKNTTLNKIDFLVDDEVTRALRPSLETAARELLLSQKLGRYILLKFHNDADGVAGAFALTGFLRTFSVQHNSAVYSSRDAVRDLNSLYQEQTPLVVLLDFGANSESKEGLELLKAAGIQTIIIDHHPLGENTSKYAFVVSPWTTGKGHELSRYTAGYLAIEIARLAGSKKPDDESLAKVSLAGDKSDLLLISQEDRDKALVLDYMSSYASFGNNLDFYKNVMRKDELFHSMLGQAREKIGHITEMARKTMHTSEINGANFYVVDLENIMKHSDFPSRGKIATQIFESLDQAKPNVVIGYGKQSIVIRVNDKAAELGIRANDMIEKVKGTMRDFIKSGGGHAKAAAVLTQDGFAKNVVEEMLRLAKA
ncbi:MAG: DHH family phosphoesterase [Candidatus Micrarchaeota archaeon]